MNIHNKTQITPVKNNCVLKDSSCDTPLPKIRMLAIFATCTSSSSTKNQESDAMLTLKKKNTVHSFIHRFTRIFKLTFGSAHSRSQRSLVGLSE
ncbi:hypothetical protein H5410_003293, partial [Solanum commersonii]